MKHLLLIVFPLVAFAGLAVADEPQLLFEDSFDTELGDGWTWLRENPDYWRIHEGALEIRAEPGHAQTVKNALLRDAPDRSQHKFAVEVTVTFASEPTQQYEQAGITWYHDKAPVFKLVHERVDGKLLVVPGHKPAPPMTVRLRLVVDGTKWTAQYRLDGDGEYQTAAEGQLPEPGDDMVSLQCYHGPVDACALDAFRRLSHCTTPGLRGIGHKLARAVGIREVRIREVRRASRHVDRLTPGAA